MQNIGFAVNLECRPQVKNTSPIPAYRLANSRLSTELSFRKKVYNLMPGFWIFPTTYANSKAAIAHGLYSKEQQVAI